MNCIEEYKNNLFEWERRIVSFLEERLPKTVIEECLAECRKDPRAFFDSPKSETITNSMRQAVAGLIYLRQLLELSEQPLPDMVETEVAAQLAFISFHAGLFVGMACPGRGVEVSVWDNERLRQLPKKANDARHAALRKFKLHAKAVSKRIWENEEEFRHHEMVRHLIEGYEENGKYPFAHLPGEPNKLSDNVLREVVKEVAHEIGRPELISGKKETKKKQNKRLPSPRKG